MSGVNGDRPRLESTLKTWSVPFYVPFLREQYNAAKASYFAGIDPKELTTVYPPSMELGFLAREAGIRVGNDAVALLGEAVKAAESI